MSDKKHDYIPRKAVEFDVFISHLLNYVRANLAKWSYIPQDRFDALETAYKAFNSALTLAEAVPTPANNLARNELHEKAVHELRAFVNQFLRFAPVTNADRTEMGIPNRDTVKTVHNVVNEMADFVLHIRNIREIIIDFWVQGHSTKAKPQGYDGVVIKYGICSAPPKNIDELIHHTMATRTPFALHFEETERGKTVNFVLAWQNARGILGGWSEIKSTIIP
jgi:hypothetical protein